MIMLEVAHASTEAGVWSSCSGQYLVCFKRRCSMEGFLEANMLVQFTVVVQIRWAEISRTLAVFNCDLRVFIFSTVDRHSSVYMFLLTTTAPRSLPNQVIFMFDHQCLLRSTKHDMPSSFVEDASSFRFSPWAVSWWLRIYHATPDGKSVVRVSLLSVFFIS